MCNGIRGALPGNFCCNKEMCSSYLSGERFKVKHEAVYVLKKIVYRLSVVIPYMNLNPPNASRSYFYIKASLKCSNNMPLVGQVWFGSANTLCRGDYLN